MLDFSTPFLEKGETVVCLGDSLTEGDYGIFGRSGIANIQPKGYPWFLEKLTGWEVRNFGKSVRW